MVARLLARSSWQFYRRHPAQLALSMLGIMLGVGIVSAVLMTNHSAQRAFELSTEALYGRSTHQIEGATGVEHAQFIALRQSMPYAAMAPVVEGYVSIDNRVFTLLGVDPFAERPFARTGLDLGETTGFALPGERSATYVSADRHTGDPGRDSTSASNDSTLAPATLFDWLTSGDALLVGADTQARLNLALDQPLTLASDHGCAPVRLVGTFTSDNPAASEGLLIGDIATVQSLLGRDGQLDRIDLILSESEARELAAQLPETLQLLPAAARTDAMSAMTRGFQVNLTAMSLLALLVGAFLIHNTMSFAVLQRRELFATKRILGVEARSLWLTVLAEAAAISLAGSIAGILLGYALAQALVGLTTRTINDLYFVLHVQDVSLPTWVLVAGIGLGVISSVLAASLAAWDAAAISPNNARQRSVAEQRAQRWFRPAALLGALSMLAGLGLAKVPSGSLVLGFVALIALIIGYGLVLPAMVSTCSAWLMRLTRALPGPGGIGLALAAGGINRNLSRTGLAITALSIAVSSTFGVALMIGSFRHSVDRWLSTTLQSDLYISAPSTVSSRADGTLDARVIDRVRALDGVQDIGTSRVVAVTGSIGEVQMLVLQTNERSRDGYEFLAGNPARAWQSFAEEQAVLISEPLANKQRLAPGDSLTLFTQAEGDQSFEVAGVFRDYGSSNGTLTMSRQLYSRYWNDPGYSSLGLILKDPATAGKVHRELEAAVQSIDQPLLIRSNAEIHKISLAVFDRTFEVTRVLRWLTVGVAFVGIFSALLALHLERAREYAVLRASGATRTQLAATVLGQSLMMGLMAGLFALPLGWVMSQLLIQVINLRSFGWSMQALLPAGSVGATLWLACGSALLAGVWPAWRLGRAPVAGLLRDE